MLGTYAVGKTSLVRRFVESVYDEKYHTTIGVKVDKKVVSVGDKEVSLLLWDLEGTEDALELRQSYLRGAAGYLLVADGTRPETLSKAMDLQTRAKAEVGNVPFFLLINKSDLTVEWKIHGEQLEPLNKQRWTIVFTSAKTGFAVEGAFMKLAQMMIGE